jgi:hypothetical protein
MKHSTQSFPRSLKSGPWKMCPFGSISLGWASCRALSVLIFSKFLAKNSIDGSCLELIEENDLTEDLGISNKIVRKKLMHCTQYY